MRKNIYLSLTFLLITSFGIAQIQKGSILLGGGINVSTSKIKDVNIDSKSNYISITPAAGIAIKNNMIVGVGIIYGHSKNYFTSTPTQSESNTYGGEVFLRKYLTLGKSFYLFGQTGFYYHSNNYNYTYTTGTVSKQNDWSTGINIYPGISYAVTKKFHLELSLAQLVNLEYSKSKITGATNREASGVNFGVNASSLSNFNIGFRVFLSK